MKNWIYILFLQIIIASSAVGQCFPDRHNTTWYDGWISCEASQNPNEKRGVSHWIMYDLGYTYHLGESHIWNANAVDYLQDGIQSAVIDVSLDGINWNELGTYEFEQASGQSTYEGFEGPDLTGTEARYLLITALSNYGGSCYGFSELRMEVNGVTSSPDLAVQDQCLKLRVFPNPISETSTIDVIAPCSSQLIKYQVLDVTGKLIDSGEWMPVSDISPLHLNLSGLESGSYFLNVSQNGQIAHEKIIKIH